MSCAATVLAVYASASVAQWLPILADGGSSRRWRYDAKKTGLAARMVGTGRAAGHAVSDLAERSELTGHVASNAPRCPRLITRCSSLH